MSLPKKWRVYNLEITDAQYRALRAALSEAELSAMDDASSPTQRGHYAALRRLVGKLQPPKPFHELSDLQQGFRLDEERWRRQGFIR